MTRAKPIRNILLAAAPPSIQLVRSILADDFTLNYVTAYGDAIRLLSPRCHLIICGVHFDEDRILNFLHYCKSQRYLAHIPFLGVQILDKELPQAEEDITKAFLEHDGAAYANLRRWQVVYGEADMRSKLHWLAEKLTDEPSSIDFITLKELSSDKSLLSVIERR